MAGGADRRPWLILSRREAVALRDAVMGTTAATDMLVDLGRALRVIAKQLEYIDYGVGEGESSTISDALRRQRYAR